MRRLGIIAMGLLLSIVATPEASAAVVCTAGVVRQDDMQGVYVNPASPMRVEIYPCGGSLVRWDNAYGSHAAAYGSTGRLPGGGIAATVLPASDAPLDASTRIGFKPAEVGYIQVITLGVYDETYRVYTLKKIA